MFKGGDIVEAVMSIEPYIKQGKRYIVDDEGDGVIYVVGSSYGFCRSNFRKANNMNEATVTLNGVEYKVENIPGKGDCLVPVKRTPKAGEVWQGPNGGIYIVHADDNTIGFELRSSKDFAIPKTATFLIENVNGWVAMAAVRGSKL